MSTFVDTVKQLAEKSSVEMKVFAYKDEKDFAFLWGLDNGDDPSKDSITERLKCWAKEFDGKDLSVVIVYDEMLQPTGDTIAVGNFVGPHDWALAASWLIYENENSCLQNFKLRILILDILDKSNNPSKKPFASWSLFAFQNALPWIQDYRVVGSDKESDVKGTMYPDLLAWQRQALPPEDRDMEMFVKDLLNPERILTTYPGDRLERRNYIELTQNLWLQNLLKAGDRHSVANLVAPAILASGLPNDPSNSFREKALKKISEGSLMRRALIPTLCEVGFLETGSPDSPTEQEGQEGLLNRYCDDRDVFGRLENIRFVLVDDHFDRGYHHILGYILFGENYDGCKATQEDNSWTFKYTHSLNCYSSLEWLLEYLEKNLEHPIDDWKQPQYLFGNPNANIRCDVLFLDLRLWEDEDKESRRKVIQKILCAAKQLLGCTPSKEVSPEFERAFKAAQDDPDKLSPEALTLLPLLLSHVDRTLPIVLFTSSHQRVVLEMLQNCPNVITSFAKPLISGYGEPITPSHSISELEKAIEKAINLHEARIAWKKISELKPRKRRFFYKNQNVSGVSEVNFDCKELRARIGMLFERCLYTRRPFSLFEEIAKPWELLEELVVQNSRPPLPDNCQFDLPPKESIDSNGPVGLAWALKENRNAKTHGKLVKEKFDQKPDLTDLTRQVLVLQFLFLLDFLGTEEARQGEPEAWASPEGLVRSTERGLGRVLCNLAKNVLWDRRQWLDKRTESALTKLWKTVIGTSLLP